MLLDVYWYFGFPTGLYHLDYFAFQKGWGGHADGPTELIANVQVPDQDTLLNQLRAAAAVPTAPSSLPPTERLRLGQMLSDSYQAFRH